MNNTPRLTSGLHMRAYMSTYIHMHTHIYTCTHAHSKEKKKRKKHLRTPSICPKGRPHLSEAVGAFGCVAQDVHCFDVLYPGFQNIIGGGGNGCHIPGTCLCFQWDILFSVSWKRSRFQSHYHPPNIAVIDPGLQKESVN